MSPTQRRGRGPRDPAGEPGGEPAAAPPAGSPTAADATRPARPPQRQWLPRLSLRSLFLSGTGFVYTAAFLSYYIQYPGLFGEDGLEPASVQFSQLQQHVGVPRAPARTWQQLHLQFTVLPSWLFMGEAFGWSTDACMEGVALLGVVLGTLVMGGCHNMVAMGTMFSLYYTLFTLGGSLLTFQWDILLLEAGALSVFYAGCWGNSSSPRPPVRWLIRVLCFKLFLMTSTVKVQADCPTWKELTALEYHHASTCIPTAAAWWMHQLPPDVNRLSVAFVFVCQLPASLLLVAPAKQMRRVAALLQVLCMVFIQVTGNYNWFNIHTALLCVPVWEDDASEAKVQGAGGAEGGARGGGGRRVLSRAGMAACLFGVAQTAYICYRSQLTLPQMLCSAAFVSLYLFSSEVDTTAWSPRLGRLLGLAFYAAAVGFLLWAAGQMYSVRFEGAHPKVQEALRGTQWEWYTPFEGMRITNRITSRWLGQQLRRVLPVLCVYLTAVIDISCLRYLLAQMAVGAADNAHGGRRRPFHIAGRFLFGTALWAVVATLFAAQWQSLDSIHRGTGAMLPKVPQLSLADRNVQKQFQNLYVVSSYGLFRRMTGVGQQDPRHAYGDRWGWGGKAPQMVRVPTLILEGSPNGPQGPWKEIEFRYKPGDVRRPPPFVAPHQPRLDWRMWFAALGSPRSDPWVVHLAAKLMLGKAAAVNLVAGAGPNSTYAFARRPPKAVRATLHHYDYTRLPTAWNDRYPGPKRIVNITSDEWWFRTDSGKQWLPPLALDSPQLDRFLQQMGWPSVRRQRALPADSDPEQACRQPQRGIVGGPTAQAQRVIVFSAISCRLVLLVRRLSTRFREQDSVNSVLLHLVGLALAARLAVRMLRRAVRRLRRGADAPPKRKEE